MNKKKVLLVVLAMVLVCAMSVMTTMALLAERVGSVTNTFVASVVDPDGFVDAFDIKEYAATADAKGNYTLNTASEVDANTYNVVPGISLPKDAFVKVSRTNETPAYLFIKVDNDMDASVFTMNVDTAVWGKLDGVTGNNGGDVYVLGTAANPTVLGKVANGEYHIIENDVVKVANSNDLKIATGTADTIKFYAYICQATVAKTDGTNTSDPAEVFGICFPNP